GEPGAEILLPGLLEGRQSNGGLRLAGVSMRKRAERRAPLGYPMKRILCGECARACPAGAVAMGFGR
ncbi:MAG: hypothetical protein K9L28_08225, partial [Synergistales bacterium]|nr:hypothetical protein [Synergistales bacterium]